MVTHVLCVGRDLEPIGTIAGGILRIIITRAAQCLHVIFARNATKTWIPLGIIKEQLMGSTNINNLFYLRINLLWEAVEKTQTLNLHFLQE